MIRVKPFLCTAVGLVMLLTTLERLSALRACGEPAPASEVAFVDDQGPSGLDDSNSAQGGVHALFNLHHPEAGPFPSDTFTVPDSRHNTGRRINLPYPDCALHPSDCEDVAVINTLDGFNLQTRLSIPFAGEIDPRSVTSDAVFLINLGSTLDRRDADAGKVVGINQIVWDTFTHTLHVESDELLAQHTRYALIVTDRVRDALGRPVAASTAFRQFRQVVGGEYRRALLRALRAAKRLGVRERDIVAASVYTTQSVTPVMERIRDQIKDGTPNPANFRLGPNGERAVFARPDVATIAWSQHTRVSPPSLAPAVALDTAVLDVVPGAIGAIAYGTFVSPAYRVPGEYIPAIGTRGEIPQVQGQEEISFTLYLPSGSKPAAGWPVAIVGVPTVRHMPMAALAASLASRGIATIGIHTAGCGFGPLGTLTITLRNGRSLTIPDRGRSVDQNGDNVIALTEGSVAAAPRAWTIGERDGYRQTAIDLLQLVRVIEIGLDVDDDGSWDVDPNWIFHLGFSAGAMHGTMFLALEPGIAGAVESMAGGMAPEHSRWSPVRRPALGALLQARTPSLINPPGITSVDGVAVAGPHFNEAKPLRNLPAVVNTVVGAMDIQRAFEMHEWGQQSGQTPIVWARHVRSAPLRGLAGKSVMYQFAKGDQQANNPGTAAFLRAGALSDRTLHYRHDLAFDEDPLIPKNPHQVLISPTHANPTFRSISRAMQAQIAAFFASGVVVHPAPARFFEVPLAEPLPESLNYIR